MHPILVAVVLLFVIGIVGAAIGGGDSGPKLADGETAGSASGAVTSVPTEDGQETSSEAAPEKTTFTVGDRVVLDDIIVTLTDASEGNGTEYNRPGDGNVFMVCSFEIENNSATDIAISSLMSFEAYVDDYSTSLSIMAIVSADKNQLGGSVAAGKKMSGVIGYELPEDWAELEINFTPDFWSGKDIQFVVNK